MSYTRRYGAAKQTVDRAAALLQKDQPAEALAKLNAADAKLKTIVASARIDAAAPKNSIRKKKTIADTGNKALTLRKKIAHAKETIMPSFPVAGPSQTIYAKGAMTHPAGFSRAGGRVQAPPGAGMFMRVPMVNGATTQPYVLLGVAGLALITAVFNTPQLPWLQYRVRGLLIERQSTGAGAVDIITVTDFREGGGPNLVLAEGRMGVESFRMGDSAVLGLRYNPIVTSPNTLTCTVDAEGIAGAGALPAGDTLLYASVLIETLDDSTYGRINTMQERLNLGHFGGGQGGGNEFMWGTPQAGTLQRVPMTNANGDTAFQLALANANLTSEQISWAQLQIVGLEIATPIKTVVTDVALVQDFRVDGGAGLFPSEDSYPAINFLGDEGGIRGGGAHTMVGLRHYPVLSSTNQATVQIRAEDGGVVAAAGAPLGAITIQYVNLIVQTLEDDVFGVAPQQTFASSAGGRPASHYSQAAQLLKC